MAETNCLKLVDKHQAIALSDIQLHTR